VTIRRIVKLLSVAVLIGAAAFFSLYCYLRLNGYFYDAVTIRGELSPQTFVQVRKWLKNSTMPGRTVIIDSTGGNGETAMAIGKLIHQYGWGVRVENRCYSSCAIFIFPAGKTKYLTKSAMLLFHGGPHQENLGKLVDNCLSMLSGKKTQDAVSCGVKDKEGVVTSSVGDEKAVAEVSNFLSIPLMTHSAEEAVNAMMVLSDEFYKELGVNPLIGNYGQTGKYRQIYESYKYNGFVYSLDSLDKLGVNNIQLVDGEWHPELNPDYKLTYEVAYP